MVAPETRKIMAVLLEDGGDARFVGGCVRDSLVNRKVVDIDIATPLTPEQVIERLARHDIPYAPTGLKHGTVTAIVDGHPFEITTLRHDVVTDGRHAEVAFTDDWRADAARRDFTINAIFATAEGELCDFFGGVEDLRLGRVRFVGTAEKRIQEDVLRILRFFRFYAHFGRAPPDTDAVKACAAAAGQIRKLSAERIRHEVLKLLEAEQCPVVWRLMLQKGIVTCFMPEATNFHMLERLVQLENQYHSPSFALRRLAAVLDVTGNGIKQVAAALRLSNEQGDQLFKMIHPGIEVSTGMTDAAVRKLVYLLGNDMARSVLLLAAAKSGNTGRLESIYQLATSFRPPRFPLQGEDVIKAGHIQGPEVGRVLRMIEEWWVSRDFAPNREACLQLLNTEFKRGSW